MEIDCQPEESIVSSFDEDCVQLGDVKDMRLEAEAVVNDVLFAVAEMHVSQSLNSASDVAYINVETREGNRYCLELTEAGLRVVGYAFDQVDEDLSTQYHETVYSLLDTLSPGYREAFWECFAPAAGEAEAKWTIERDQDAANIVQVG